MGGSRVGDGGDQTVAHGLADAARDVADEARHLAGVVFLVQPLAHGIHGGVHEAGLGSVYVAREQIYGDEGGIYDTFADAEEVGAGAAGDVANGSWDSALVLLFSLLCKKRNSSHSFFRLFHFLRVINQIFQAAHPSTFFLHFWIPRSFSLVNLCVIMSYRSSSSFLVKAKGPVADCTL